MCNSILIEAVKQSMMRYYENKKKKKTPGIGLGEDRWLVPRQNLPFTDNDALIGLYFQRIY